MKDNLTWKPVWNEKVNRWEVYEGISAIARIASSPADKVLGRDNKKIAQLIAAAPQLLKACRILLSFMKKHHPIDGESAINALETGIKKAEGKL